MELDGYCATLGIAFEHQGEQHYSTKAHFLKREFDLSRRQEDDALKFELCAQRGITLVVVPQIPERLPVDQVRAFIKEQLAAKGIPLPQCFDTRDVDINKAYRTSGSREILNHLRRIATEHGGQCLSTSYINDNTNLSWQCAQGHKWEATPSNTKRGHWCPFCAGRGKTIQDMQQLAASRGGRCLSDGYINGTTQLLWQCKEGHQWQASPFHVLRDTWCPFCAGFGKTIEDMQQLAAQRGGKCLSPAYEGMLTNLLWECSQGHQWQAVPSSINVGTWCPYCAGRGKTIQDMQELASQNAGQCLSPAFLGVRTRLLWQCAEGHQWKATPDSVSRGSWCPVCANKRRGRRRREAP